MKLHTAAAWLAALFLASNLFSHIVSVRLLLLTAGIVLAGVAVLKNQEILKLPPIWIPFVAWGAWAAMSLAWSIEPDRTLKEWRNEVFYTGAGLWMCFVAAQARNATGIMMSTVGAAAVIACAIGWYEFARGWEHYLVGWHGGPGDHSSALLVLVPCTAMAGWYASRAGWSRWMLGCIGVMAVILIGAAYTTLNRTIWLAFALQFLLLGFLTLWRAKTKGIATAIAVVVVAGCGAIILNIQAERETTVHAKPFEQDPRLALWPKIIDHVAERPITGYGFGRGLLRDSLQDKFKSLDQHLWHAHNIFLDALVQLGVPGVVLLGLLLAVVVHAGWRLSREPDEARAACGIALMAVVAGMLVRNMTDSLLVRQNALLFWGIVGVLLGIGGYDRTRLPSSR